MLSRLEPLATPAEVLAPEALLAAVAAAWAMGIDPDLIAAGVQTFGPVPDSPSVPGMPPVPPSASAPRSPSEDRKND